MDTQVKIAPCKFGPLIAHGQYDYLETLGDCLATDAFFNIASIAPVLFAKKNCSVSFDSTALEVRGDESIIEDLYSEEKPIFRTSREVFRRILIDFYYAAHTQPDCIMLRAKNPHTISLSVEPNVKFRPTRSQQGIPPGYTSFVDLVRLENGRYVVEFCQFDGMRTLGEFLVYDVSKRMGEAYSFLVIPLGDEDYLNWCKIRISNGNAIVQLMLDPEQPAFVCARSALVNIIDQCARRCLQKHKRVRLLLDAEQNITFQTYEE